MIHNKIPTKERLHRINLASDPNCDFCISTAGSLVCDIEHMFCICQRVSEVWNEIRNKLSRIVSNNISDADLIPLNFPVNRFNNEIVWLIGSYVYKIWESNYCQGNLV